ncbi:uncharacterized protein LOC123425322 [Hordeum vulgare subsp. vulgare]|uniref:uncharacterized protein LOC123425322 n=1 Tax=Hordeum vulgare subsp. vulgare TaxID=112509 RepID=UPI001D1A598D|nr:uncharacterized protein LOC123425322 [Hordeum vulgare subsp. vulgare]
MAAAHQFHGLLRLPPPRLLRPVLVPPTRCRAPPPLASPRVPHPPRPLTEKRLSSASQAKSETAAALLGEEEENGAAEHDAREAREGAEGYVESVGAGDPAGPPPHHLAVRAGLGDPVFFLLTFVAVTTSIAFTSMVAVAIPTMLAMRRAANSFTLLADAVLDELPSTMTAVRLSGMEISDFTLELSDLSQVVADGVNKSTNIVQAVEDGIGQMRNITRQKTK